MMIIGDDPHRMRKSWKEMEKQIDNKNDYS